MVFLKVTNEISNRIGCFESFETRQTNHNANKVHVGVILAKWKNAVSSGGERGNRNCKLHPQAVSSAQLLPGRNAGSV